MALISLKILPQEQMPKNYYTLLEKEKENSKMEIIIYFLQWKMNGQKIKFSPKKCPLLNTINNVV